MYCDNCGYKLDAGMTVCPVCGKVVETEVNADKAPNPMDKLVAASEINNSDEIPTMIIDKLDGGESGKSAKPETDNKVKEEVKEEIKEERPSVTESFVEEEDGDEGTTVLTRGPIPNMGGANVPPMPNMGGANVPPMPNMGGANVPPMPNMGGVNVPPMPNMGSANVPPMPNMGGPNMTAPGKKSGKGKQPKQSGGKKKMPTGLKVAFIVLAVLIVAAGVTFAVLFLPKIKDYKDAESKLEDGNVEEAVAIYTDLGSFKDSETMANGGAYYEYASDMMENGNYEEAAKYFDKAAALNYEDASSKAKECYYNVGDKYKAEGKYDEAITAYDSAGDYPGAADAANQCRYDKGISYMSEGDYDSAIACFEELGSYSDSADKIGECYYNKAVTLVADGEYMEAYDYFIKSEYSDYNEQANETMYMYAQKCFDEGKYEDAIEYYGKVEESYKNCTKAIDKCYVALAKDAYKNKEYEKSIEYYESAKETDVTKGVRDSKLAYIKEHKDAKDALAMKYLGDLRYAGNTEAAGIYAELIGWDISSYVNHEKEDYDTQNHTVDTKSDIYIHTTFLNSDGQKLNIEGYLVYSDGKKSNIIDFGEVEDSFITWVSLSSGDAVKGLTYMYITDKTSGNIVEVYPFVIE